MFKFFIKMFFNVYFFLCFIFEGFFIVFDDGVFVYVLVLFFIVLFEFLWCKDFVWGIEYFDVYFIVKVLEW